MTLAVGDNRLYFSAYKWNSRCFEIALLATCCEQIHYARVNTNDVFLTAVS